MQEVQILKEQIKLNCNISDARYWGYYSICGLLMRLRELYRNEHQLKPWDRIDNISIGRWIEKREALWHELENTNLRPLHLEHSVFDPFDSQSITERLGKNNLVYGAGFALYGKPSFFLARADKKEEIQGFVVYYTSEELCRDLSASSAMQQANAIYIRKEPLLYKLWSKYLELRGRRFGGALSEAFSSYNISSETEPDRVKGILPDILNEITDILLYHEIAEATESEDLKEWSALLQSTNNINTELYLRALKDIIADTSDYGPIKKIVETENERLLNFYIVLSERTHRTITPEIINAYQRFKESLVWNIIEEARQTLYFKSKAFYKRLIALWKETQDQEKIKGLIKDLSIQGLR
ncbi:MAG: hypothetical protein GXO99_02515 [Nitrospirae bacterium]|nr:hypothetical protein [Nitrospirota bacterium]